MKKLKKAPAFKNEEEEFEFWSTHDSTEYMDWSRAARVSFPNLKPSTRTISLRLPAWLLDELKVLANKQDIPYQSLMKMYLSERIAQERKKTVQLTRLNRYSPFVAVFCQSDNQGPQKPSGEGPGHRPGRPGYLAATARTAGLSRAVRRPLSRSNASPTRHVAVRVSPVQ